MLKQSILTIALAGAVTVVAAQPTLQWSKEIFTSHDIEMFDFVEAGSGNYIVVTSTGTLDADTDIELRKINATPPHDIAWTRSFKGGGRAWPAVTNSASDILIRHVARPGGQYLVQVTRVSASGDSLNTEPLGIRALRKMHDGRIISTTLDTVFEMDDQGREVDAHHIPAMPCSRPNVLREMYVLPDETFFYYSCWDGDRPAVLVRLTPQWTIDTRSEMAAKPEAITKIDADYYRLYRQTPRVSVILNGEPLVPTDTTVDSTGNFLVRLNGQGDTLNVEEYFWSGLHEMVPLPEGGLAMAGDWRVARTGDRWAQGTDSLARTILVGTDNNGEILWKVDTLPMDGVRVLKVCDDGGLLVAGGKENAGGTKGVVVMKFEPEVTIAARDDMRPRPGAASLQARTPAPTRYVDLRGRHVADGSPGRGGGGSTASGILIGFTEKGLRTRLIVGD